MSANVEIYVILEEKAQLIKMMKMEFGDSCHFHFKLCFSFVSITVSILKKNQPSLPKTVAFAFRLNLPEKASYPTDSCCVNVLLLLYRMESESLDIDYNYDLLSSHEPSSVTFLSPSTKEKKSRLVSSLTNHLKLLSWVERVRSHCMPNNVHWCDGSQEEYDSLCQELGTTVHQIS